MNRISLLAAAILFANAAGAQDLDDLKKTIYLGKDNEAKAAVDAYLAVEKNAKKADGWYYKGFVYNKISKDTSKSIADNSALKMESFSALKKYREMDAKATLLNEENNSTFFDLYVGFSSDLGVKAYSNKQSELAFDNFKKALEVHDYVYANNMKGNGGFSFSALDTTLVLYAGIAASDSKKNDEAAVYYKKLVDANVEGDSYLEIYYFLIDHYKSTKQHAPFEEVLGKARKAYPANAEYWTAVETEEATDGIAKPAVFAKFDELLVKHPESNTLAYNYAVGLYSYIYSDEAKGINTDTYKAKFVEVLKKAIALKSTYEANFLMANYLYNNSADIADEARKLKGPKPEDLKKRKQLEAESASQMNESVPYLEKVLELFPGLTKPRATDKINHKQAITMLKNIYDVKKDAAKSAQYDKMLKELQ